MQIKGAGFGGSTSSSTSKSSSGSYSYRGGTSRTGSVVISTASMPSKVFQFPTTSTIKNVAPQLKNITVNKNAVNSSSSAGKRTVSIDTASGNKGMVTYSINQNVNQGAAKKSVNSSSPAGTVTVSIDTASGNKGTVTYPVNQDASKKSAAINKDAVYTAESVKKAITDSNKVVLSKVGFDYEKANNLSKEASVINNNGDINANWQEFLDSLSNSKFKNIEGLNKYISDKVNSAGYGTLDGVLAAVNVLAYDYPKETGSKFFYTSDLNKTMRYGTDGLVPGVSNMDCRGFVQWALYNGGYDADIVKYRLNDDPDNIGFQNWGEANGLVMSDINNAKPGDVFSGSGDGSSHGGHIWMVVGNYDDGYYVAEEYGSKNGLVINKYSYDEHAKQVETYNAKGYDMSGYYDDITNVRKVNV